MIIDLFTIFSSVYGLISLFFIVIASSFIILPEMGLLITSYASFVNTIPNLVLFILLVFIASLIGDLSVYFLARKFSDKIKNFLKRFKWYTKNERKTYLSLSKYEFTFVFFSRFIGPGACPAVNYISGFEKLNYKKFITAVALGEAVYSIGYSLIGYAFKDTWKDLLNFVQYGLITIVLVAIAIYLAFRIIKFYRNKRAEVLFNQIENYKNKN
jgi:membrane protein DedA with SNARE-associated domain